LPAQPSISAMVMSLMWEDYNNDGDMDAGEPGVSSLTVTLVDTNTGQTVGTTTTDASGYYTFTGLPESKYEVSVALPAGYVSSTPDAGNPDSDLDDSDDNGVGAAGSTVSSGAFDLTPGQEVQVDNNIGYTADPHVDFGIWQPMNLGNRVWLDDGIGIADNGILDGGEQGIDGVTVELHRDDDGTPGYSAGDSLVGTDTTQGGGYYEFTSLISDTYVVHIPATDFAAGQPLVNPPTMVMATMAT